MQIRNELYSAHKKRTVLKILKATFVFLLCCIIGNALSSQEMCLLTVKVTEIKRSECMIRIGMFSSEESWLAHSFMSKKARISNDRSTLIFEDVPFGEFGISLYHDENNNGKMDIRFSFLPKENYSCSNQVKGSFDSLNWVDAKFQLNKSNQEIPIKL